MKTTKETRRAELLAYYEALKNDRSSWEAHWNEINKYVQPRRGDMYGTDLRGDERMNHLYDSTSIHSSELLSSALHSMLTNPAQTFFTFTTGEVEKDALDSVRRYIHDVSDIIHMTLRNSNFHTQVYQCYKDQTGIGTGPFRIEEHPTKDVNFIAESVANIVIDEDVTENVDTLFRRYVWSWKKVVQKFGLNVLPEEMRDNVTKKPSDRVEIIQAIIPSSDPRADKKFSDVGFESYSMTFMKEHNVVLSESGFHEFPYAVPRWSKQSEEMYGRSPAMKCLPDIRMLNAMMQCTIRGAQQQINPALQMVAGSTYKPVRLVPGQITVRRPGSEPISPIVSGARLDISEVMMEGARNRIRQAFFIDQLQLPDGPQKTATEVRQRANESLRLMGPVLSRQDSELLEQVITRTYNILKRKGKLPKPPKELQGSQFIIRYTSAISKIQRTSEVINFQNTIAALAPYVESDPAILDNIDGDAAFRYVADVYDLPSIAIRSTQDRDKIREGRAKAQQEAIAAQNNNQEIDNALKLMKRQA